MLDHCFLGGSFFFHFETESLKSFSIRLGINHWCDYSTNCNHQMALTLLTCTFQVAFKYLHFQKFFISFSLNAAHLNFFHSFKQNPSCWLMYHRYLGLCISQAHSTVLYHVRWNMQHTSLVRGVESWIDAAVLQQLWIFKCSMELWVFTALRRRAGYRRWARRAAEFWLQPLCDTWGTGVQFL